MNETQKARYCQRLKHQLYSQYGAKIERTKTPFYTQYHKTITSQKYIYDNYYHSVKNTE